MIFSVRILALPSCNKAIWLFIFIMTKHLLITTTLITTSLVLQTSFAQTIDTPIVGDAIIISGQSRTQELQDVPMAISVISADQIKKLGANNISEFNGYVPGLVIDSHQITQPKFSLRGIESVDFLIGTDSPVGIYVDDVYTGKTGGALLNFNDVKRVEVLKGPQSILFGRNSSAGAVSIISNEPEAKFGASTLVRIGNYGMRHIEFMINQPINSDMAFRMSAVGQFSDGWVRDSVTGQAYEFDGEWGTRMALKWQKSKDTSVNLSWEHENLKQKARPTFGLQSNDPNTYLDPRSAPLLSDVPDSKETRNFNGVTLRIEHALPWADLTSITGYRHFTSYTKQDLDGTKNASTSLFNINFDKNSSFQQEIKINAKSALLDVVSGISYFSEHATQNTRINTTTSSLDTIYKNKTDGQFAPFELLTNIAGLYGISDINLLGQPWQENMYNRADNKAASIYGDVIWHLSKTTNLTTGVRFTRDDKIFSWRYPRRVAQTTDAQLAVLSNLGFFQDPNLADLYFGNPNLGFEGVSNNVPLVYGELTREVPLQVKKSWTNTSPRIVLDHKLNENTLIYSSLTKGYQAGGFSGLSSNGVYAPETISSYEVGAKGKLISAGFTYNASFFHYDLKNLQSLQLIGIGGDGFPKYATQTSNRKAKGVDLDMQWQVNRFMKLFSAHEYIDLKYTNFISPLGTVLDGQVVGVPKFTSALGLDLNWVGLGGKFNALLQGSHTSKVRCNSETINQSECLKTPIFAVGTPRSRVDFRLQWENPSQLVLALTVNNLQNKQFVTFVENTVTRPFDVAYGERTSPRKFSVEISRKF